MNASLLFFNALSAQLNPATYERARVQDLVARRLVLPLQKLQACWLEVDMTPLQTAPPESLAERTQRTLQELFGRTPWIQHSSPQHWHAVILVPAHGHVAALRALHREATRATDGHNAAIIVLYQEDDGPPQLFHVMPEPEHDPVFKNALTQTRNNETGTP
jgi:hypothetical protein